MAKDPAEQQRTDAERIPEAGSGKLDQRGEPGAGEEWPIVPASASDLDATRERLERERQAAIERLRQRGLSPDADETGSQSGSDNEADRAQTAEGRELEFQTRQMLADRINRLTVALERIATGRYGQCASCGGPIEAARLSALPETETCVRCQTQREARNAAA